MSPFPDEDAFRRFVESNFAGVASFSRSLLGSALESEDVAQEAFVRLFQARERLRADISPRAYLYRVAQRLCLGRLRREARRAALAVLMAPLVARESPPAGEPLDSWFRALPRRQRAIAHLHFAEDLESPEIARRLGLAPSTVRVQLARVLARLRASRGASAERKGYSHVS